MTTVTQRLTQLILDLMRERNDALDRIAAARAICLDVETGAVPPAAASEAYGLATDVLHALRGDYLTDDDTTGDDE